MGNISSKGSIYLKRVRKVVMTILETLIALIGSIFSGLGLILVLVENKKTAKKFIVVGLVLISLSFGFSVLDSIIKGEEESARSPSGIISSNYAEMPCICLGNSCTEGYQNVATLGNDKIFVRVEKGQLKVSALVRDESGKIMGEIKDDAFESFSPYALKCNHDDTGWEVIDPYGRVALQVDMVKSCAHIAGIFYMENGKGALIASGNGSLLLISGNTSQMKSDIIKIWERNPDIIAPIFVYPSADNPGKRIHPVALEKPLKKIYAFVKQIGL